MKQNSSSNGGSAGGEIIQVQGGHIVRSIGRKDRHSKVFTAKGPRDRRVRLSAHTAIQFYDVQDRLGYDRPSKAVDWLIKKAKTAIDGLAELPPWNPNPNPTLDLEPVPEPEPDPQASQIETPDGYGQLGGLSFFPASNAVSDHQPHHGFHAYPPESHSAASADHLGLSLHSFHADQEAAPATEQALFGFGLGAGNYNHHRMSSAWNETPVITGFNTMAFNSNNNQRGTLQSSTTNNTFRPWDQQDHLSPHHHSHRPSLHEINHNHNHNHNNNQSSSSSIFGTRFFSDGNGGGGFPVYCIPARIHGEDVEVHGVVAERPSASSSPNSAHR